MSHTCYVPQVGPLCTEKNSQKLRSRFPVVTRIDFMKNTCNSMKKEEVKITYRKQRKQNKAKEQEIKGNLVLLGRVASSLSKWFPVFHLQGSISLLSKWIFRPWSWDHWVISKKIVSNYRVAWLHTLEEVIPQLRRCKNLTGPCTYKEYCGAFE
jgi:hypothetical protein